MAQSPSSSPGALPPYHSMMACRDSPPCSPSARPIHSSSFASGHTSRALPIRGSQQEVAPPALPPPQYAPVGMQQQETWLERQAPKYNGSVPQSSSLFGSSFSRPPPLPRSAQKATQYNAPMPPSPLRDLQFSRNIKQEDDSNSLPS